MAERAILAIGRQDWRAAEALVDQARSVVAGAHLEECVTSLVVYAAGAQVDERYPSDGLRYFRLFMRRSPLAFL